MSWLGQILGMGRRGDCVEGVVGVFAHVDSLVDAAIAAREDGIEVRDAFSPVPNHEILDLVQPQRSPVRFLTLGGAVTGLVSGLALALLTSIEWNLVVGGKPVTSIVPFVIVGFELTILLGALATFAGLLGLARLPYTRFPGPAFRPEFTRDRFGLWLVPGSGKQEKAIAILERAGATEVHPLAEEAAAESSGEGAEA